MSWSFSAIGKPEKIAEALEKHSETLNGQSKVEFDTAKPHLIALVKENFAAEGSGYNCPLLKIDANGSGAANSDKQLNRNCTVKIESFYGNLLL